MSFFSTWIEGFLQKSFKSGKVIGICWRFFFVKTLPLSKKVSWEKLKGRNHAGGDRPFWSYFSRLSQNRVEKWKVARQIFKGENKSHVICYRPLNRLCCISKVFGRLVFDVNVYYNHIQSKLHRTSPALENIDPWCKLIFSLDKTNHSLDNAETSSMRMPYLDFCKTFDDLLLQNVQIHIKIGRKGRKIDWVE